MSEETGRYFIFTVSYYEIYSGKVYDLLNNHEKLKIQEDKNQQIIVCGLYEQHVKSPEEMIELIQFGSSVRQTHATASNDTSSRSHAVCTIRLYELSRDQQGHEK